MSERRPAWVNRPEMQDGVGQSAGTELAADQSALADTAVIPGGSTARVVMTKELDVVPEGTGNVAVAERSDAAELAEEPLDRKKLARGLVILALLIAGAILAGLAVLSATFSDTKSPSVSAPVGTVKVAVGGGSVNFAMGQLAPGDPTTQTMVVENVGTLPGSLRVDASQLTCKDADGNELADASSKLQVGIDSQPLTSVGDFGGQPVDLDGVMQPGTQRSVPLTFLLDAHTGNARWNADGVTCSGQLPISLTQAANNS